MITSVTSVAQLVLDSNWLHQLEADYRTDAVNYCSYITEVEE